MTSPTLPQHVTFGSGTDTRQPHVICLHLSFLCTRPNRNYSCKMCKRLCFLSVILVIRINSDEHTFLSYRCPCVYCVTDTHSMIYQWRLRLVHGRGNWGAGGGHWLKSRRHYHNTVLEGSHNFFQSFPSKCRTVLPNRPRPQLPYHFYSPFATVTPLQTHH